MGKINGTAPCSISGSVGNYTYRQTKDGYIVSEKRKKCFGKSLEDAFESILSNPNAQSVGEVTINIQGTNKGNFNQPVKLSMYDTSNGTNGVDVDASKNAAASTSSVAVLKATVAAGLLHLGADILNDSGIKAYAPTCGSCGGYDTDKTKGGELTPLPLSFLLFLFESFTNLYFEFLMSAKLSFLKLNALFSQTSIIFT
ncbi:MAG: hypothetical protein MJZ62_04300 [Bacteroidales bacterium]|nr:hypothetical protein [Bacteroidales bacterium]